MNRLSELVDIKKIVIKNKQSIENHKLQENYIRVKIRATGICGSDISYFKNGGLGSHKIKFPMTMGHEPSGEVLISNNSNFKKGDRVAIEPNLPCIFFKNENYCSCDSRFNLCSESKFLGSYNCEGTFQDEIDVHVSQLLKINHNTSFEEATILEPFSVAMHSFDKLKFQIGMKVAILGGGPIGICLAIIAKISGASEIIIFEKLSYRSDFIQNNLGFKTICTNQNSEEMISRNRNSFHVVFDAAGKSNTFNQALILAKSGGFFCLVGIPVYDTLEYNPHVARIKELTIVNTRRSNNFLHKSYEIFLEKKLPFSKIITHRFELNDIQKGFVMNSEYSNSVMKTVIVNEN
jgi:L-iditol 2-dehydrogenase